MRILYIGSVRFSAELLKYILGLEENIIGIIALANSTYNSDYCDLIPISQEKNIDNIAVENINSSETINWIVNKKPDIIFCFGWSRILCKQILMIPKLGVLGFHPSLLPINKGRHPIIWSIVLGLRETGSTFFFMDEGVDSGDIVSQKKINISENDDALSLYQKIETSAKKQIKLLLPQLKEGNYLRIKQNNLSSNSWRKRSFNDGLIDWRMSSFSIHQLVKALTKPYPGASFVYKKRNYVVWETEVVECFLFNLEPGKVISCSREGIVIKTGDSAIKLLKIEPYLKINSNSYL